MTGSWKLATTALGLALAGCSKTNDVDVNNGGLAAGSECVAQAEDPCAGACIGGLCRMPCGVNRECPANLRCVGDGDHAGCVPDSFGHVNLLEDCAEGCVTPLADFGREGHFYRCDTDFSPELELDFTSSRPAIDPTAMCNRVLGRVWSVKGQVAWLAGEVCEWTHWGVTGDKVVQHTCRPSYFEDAGDITSAGLGWLYASGGETYWLNSLWGGVQLFKFQAESVGELPDNCFPYFDSYGAAQHPDDPAACPSPTYPPIGAAASKYAGYWIECTPISEEVNKYPEYDIDACVLQKWGEGEWTWESGIRDALYVREDGYGVDADLSAYDFERGCTNAFRLFGGDAGRVAVLRLKGGLLDVRVEAWDLIEHGGETFLRRREKTSPNSGPLLRRLPRPAELAVDPCGGSRPLFGF